MLEGFYQNLAASLSWMFNVGAAKIRNRVRPPECRKSIEYLTGGLVRRFVAPGAQLWQPLYGRLPRSETGLVGQITMHMRGKYR